MILESFRGKGRGRGFEVVREGSGLKDEALARSVHDKLVTILRSLESHGRDLVTLTPLHSTAELASVHAELETMMRNLETERESRNRFERQVRDLTADLEQEHAVRLNTLALAGKLSQDLDRAKRVEGKLLTASHRCIMTLKQLREELRTAPFASHSLTSLVHDVKGIVDLVQELRLLSSAGSAGPAGGFVTR